MPQRITDDLVNMLKKYHPIYVNTHFNHPKEITAEAKEACAKLADAGIPLGQPERAPARASTTTRVS